MTRRSGRRSVRAVLIDDNLHDRELYAGLLSKRGVLSVQPLSYVDTPGILAALEREACDVVLVDYQLDEQHSSGSTIPRLGTTFSAYLRERVPDMPILLVTRGSLFTKFGLAGSEDESEAFDDVLVKNEIRRSPITYRDEILKIVSGFERLKSVAPYRGWDALCKLLGATEREQQQLREADPPRVPIDSEGWRVPTAARWIRKTLVRYPGVLYCGLYAASALGLSEASFQTPVIRRWFDGAQYTGPFAPSDGAWWKSRLLERALLFLAKAGQQTTTAHRFCSSWNDGRKTNLRPSRCVVDGSSPAECVCHILQKPVKRSNSLPYRPDNRPRVMDEARVSFKAVRESQEFNETLVAPDVPPGVVRAIQRGSKSP